MASPEPLTTTVLRERLAELEGVADLARSTDFPAEPAVS